MRVTPEQQNREQTQKIAPSSSEQDTRMSVATAQPPLSMGSHQEGKGRLPPVSTMLPPLKPRTSIGTTSSSYAQGMIGQTPDIYSRTNVGRPPFDRSESDPRFDPGLSDGSSENSEQRYAFSRSPNERPDSNEYGNQHRDFERSEIEGPATSSYFRSQQSEMIRHAPFAGGYDKPSWSAKEHEVQVSGERMSSMSIKQSVPTAAYPSPGLPSATHQSYVQSREHTFSSDAQTFAHNRSAQSPSPSAMTTMTSDPYGMDNLSTISSSSSLRAPAQHLYRSQIRSSTKPYEIVSSTPTELDMFNQLWDVMMEVRRQIERFQSSQTSNAGPRPLPSIRDGDVATLTSHLQYEIDVLAESDSRMADHFALDVRHLHDQLSQQKQQNRARSNTVSLAPWRDRSSFSHYYPYQSFHSSSPLMHPRGSLPNPQIPPGAPYNNPMTEGYGEIPSSAPPVGRGQEMYHPPYNYHQREYSNQGRDTMMMNQRTTGYSRRPSSGFAMPMHEGRFTSGPSSPQSEMRYVSSGQFTPNPHLPVHQGRLPQAMPRRVRKRRDEADQSCLSCSAKETPEWRKGPTGPRTLCNACGLLYAKQCRKRELELQTRGKRQKGSRTNTTDEMTTEERENSLLELQSAVQTRVNQNNPVSMGIPDSTSGGGSGAISANDTAGSTSAGM